MALWDLPSGRQLQVLDGSPGLVHSVAFSPSGRILACCSDDRTRLFRFIPGPDEAGGSYEIEAVPERIVATLAAMPWEDGRTIAVQQPEGVEILRFGRAFDERLAVVPAPGGVGAFAWSPGADLLAVAVADAVGGTRVVANVGEENSSTVLLPHPEPVSVLAFAGSGWLLATGDTVGTVRVWNLATTPVGSAPALELPAHSGRVTALAWSPDERTLVSAGFEGGLSTWNVPRLPAFWRSGPDPSPPSSATKPTSRLVVLPARHGTSLVLELGPTRMVIDGGPATSFERGLRAWLSALPPDDRRIDVLAVTHTDDQAIGGVMRLLEDADLGATIGELWANGLQQAARLERDRL